MSESMRLLGASLLRRTFARLLLVPLVVAGTLGACGGGSDDKWAASWFAAQLDRQQSIAPTFPAPPEKSMAAQTIRQVVYASAAGSRARLTFSNLFGTAPVTFDAVTLARPVGTEGAIDAASVKPVLFSGRPSVTIAAGAQATSDAVAFDVAADATLAVSIYVSQPTQVRTVHSLARQRNFVGAGDLTAVAAPPWSEVNDTPTTADGGYTAWLTELDVRADSDTRVLVAFGDSITDGYASTLEANRRWPNVLSRIVAADPSTYGPFSVVDAGISGNRWKHDLFGPAGEGRFARDVLDVAGVTHVSIMLGINDIGFPVLLGSDAQLVEAPTITAAIQAAVDQAKARNLKVMVGTLTPFKDALYWSDAGEQRRGAVNDFIRSGLQHADAIVDFDAALRDAADPLRLAAAYDSGDRLHPNDAGYERMAQAVANVLKTVR